MNKRKEMALPISQIFNLTSTPVSSYTRDGDIITIPPTLPEDIKIRPDSFFIVGNKPQSIRINCLKILSTSKGRGGVPISVLVLYDKQDIRVYPMEG